jgi:hypothetical protein
MLNVFPSFWREFVPRFLPSQRNHSRWRHLQAAQGLTRRVNPSFLVCLLLLGGCQSPVHSLFTATGPGWHIQQGQAVWRPERDRPEFGGDLVLASDQAGRHLIQFDKTPMAILSAQTTSNRWLIQFPPRDLSFSGYGAGPTRFAWLYLPRALDGKPLPPALHFEHKPDGGWRLENTRTGESLEGFLAP